jgi:phosphatidylinositol-3-phosphatase
MSHRTAQRPIGRLLLLPVLLALATGGAPAGAAVARPAEPATVVAAPARAVSPAITKVLTFVVENHSLAQMKASMPYVYRLAKKYAYADHYQAVTHPSLPNYLAMASGGTQGVTDDADPAAHPLGGQTVFDQALALGRTATVYADAMTTRCQLTGQRTYAVKHNPWAYFVDSRASCQKHDVPVGRLARDIRTGRLPNAGMVVPDLVHDAHDAPLGTADAWLKKQIKLVRSGPDWKSGHLAIVVTADEDDYNGDNTVLTVVASRYQVQRVVHDPLTHYSLTALYDAVLGATPLGEAAHAPSMVTAFDIRLTPGS